MKTVGAKLSKYFLGLSAYIKDPMAGPGDLTTAREAELAKIMNRNEVHRSLGVVLMKSGLEAAFSEFVAHHTIPGVTEWHMFADTYRDSKADTNVNLPCNPTELAKVERIIGYTFTNKKLLAMALTVPRKKGPGPNYNRLEFLGDAVMELITIQAWIDEGSVVHAALKTERSACNRASQAVCIAAGLHDFIKKCSQDKKERIKAIKAAYEVLNPSSPNKPYWNQGLHCKTLGAAVTLPRKTAKNMGVKLIKMFLSLHLYVDKPDDGHGSLSKLRDSRTPHHQQPQRGPGVLVGEALIKSGLEAAFSEFLTHHAIPGIANWQTLQDAYRNSKADKNTSLPYVAARLAQEGGGGIIGYIFTNKKPLELALTAPVKSKPGPNYNRLEYLGNAVMEVVVIQAWTTMDPSPTVL
ncbi:MAG: hypothetical protein J3Q66DRAFT_408478 [Benniella sp.]|nr:MAG: hypothetical protein J3Q66DRAFT_408478 [Benniella sp.]